MAMKPCARSGCDKTFDNKGKWRRKYCSKECSVKTYDDRLINRGELIREKRKTDPPKCVICGEPIKDAVRSNQKYCGDACAGRGLIDAIQRQRDRRKKEKESRNTQHQLTKPS